MSLRCLRFEKKGAFEGEMCAKSRRWKYRMNTQILKESPLGLATQSAHPARFSPDDKFSRQRVLLKKRFGLLPTQKPAPKY
ncbi:hypothetical protein RHMOL_Rhmol13G0045100 [Rhododendron molle]|uniref:Uncharacterized protein n=1 Tax=Rhododendron molle TaxID=49168 RepID=A0ACC0L4F7_RHOML|nr:hypothetical protein RHMOL_Rhmol13G0045100 [Rhododendron molle]